jgi:FxsC-like protein
VPARFYFYLSYGHTPRLRDDERADTDHWAARLFAELSAEVAMLVRADRRDPVGYFDDLAHPLADGRATLARVLSATDVFVALYSPGYFAKAWPLRELASFAGRFADRRTADRFLLPVLWVPWARWEREQERAAALRIGAGLPAYAEEGLQAMSRLAEFRDQYRTIVRRLATHIVTAAGDAPRPAPEAVVTDRPAPRGAGFTVDVLAPTRGDLPPGRAPAPYGTTPRAWNPYRGSQRYPVAEYVATVAERLGHPARVGDLPAGGAGVVLVDPWLAGTAAGRRHLAGLAGRLPSWATVLLIADEDDPEYAARGAHLHTAVTDTLVAAGVGRGRITLITDAGRLADRLPWIIDNACHAYRKNSPVFLPKGADSPLPRIAGEAGVAGGEGTND